jgi:hypothetical protein
MRKRVLATLLGAALLAGCGASSRRPAAMGDAGSLTATGSTVGASTASGSSAAMLAFSRCMRANGATNFPDPNSAGGVSVHMSVSAPGFEPALAKCRKLLPDASTGPPFDPQALAQLRKIAVCMRQHGVPDFPDPERAAAGSPRAGVPSGHGANAAVTDYRGVLLEFPATLNPRSPAFEQAATACSGGFLNRR